ncbi:MAG: hypothetical protein OXT65_01385 [Alphaproteobacteria bacterium]|nr:hypothetical protein [Alphaproteobacteria bacterium]
MMFYFKLYSKDLFKLFVFTCICLVISFDARADSALNLSVQPRPWMQAAFDSYHNAKQALPVGQRDELDRLEDAFKQLMAVDAEMVGTEDKFKYCIKKDKQMFNNNFEYRMQHQVWRQQAGARQERMWGAYNSQLQRVNFMDNVTLRRYFDAKIALQVQTVQKGVKAATAMGEYTAITCQMLKRTLLNR